MEITNTGHAGHVEDIIKLHGKETFIYRNSYLNHLNIFKKLTSVGIELTDLLIYLLYYRYYCITLVGTIVTVNIFYGHGYGRISITVSINPSK